MNQYEQEEDIFMNYAAIKPILKKYRKLSHYQIIESLDEIMGEIMEISGQQNLNNMTIWFRLMVEYSKCQVSKVILAKITPRIRGDV
jgi:hypothetical protein